VALARVGQDFVDDLSEDRNDGLPRLRNSLINIVEIERMCGPCSLALLAPFAFLTTSRGGKPCILLIVPCAPLGDAVRPLESNTFSVLSASSLTGEASTRRSSRARPFHCASRMMCSRS
jgi:hypothetical protein